MTPPNHYIPRPHDRQDPHTWDIVYLDQALPMDPLTKACWIKDRQNWTRAYVLGPIRVITSVVLAVVMVLRRVIPVPLRAHGLMHQITVWLFKAIATPEASYLLVRHFSVGSNVINFLIDNGPDPEITKSKLYPHTVDDLNGNTFVNRDLNLYNFVYDYHQAEQQDPNWLETVHRRGITFNSIQSVEIDVPLQRRQRWIQFLDLESSLELLKIIYAACLTSKELERSVVSFQFNESFGLYFSRLMNDYRWNHVVRNAHPLVPASAFDLSRHFILHAITLEYLHRYLELQKLYHETYQSEGSVAEPVSRWMTAITIRE